MSENSSFTCPQCSAMSNNAHDITNGYCGRCHAYTGRDDLGEQFAAYFAVVDRVIDEMMTPAYLERGLAQILREAPGEPGSGDQI